MKVSHVSAADHDLVTAAVATAEARTSGEIVTVIAAQSNDYDDVALVWASLIAFLAMSVIALFPDFYQGLYDRLTGGWGHGLTANQWLGVVIAVGVLKWIAMWLILLWRSPAASVPARSTCSRSGRRRRRSAAPASSSISACANIAPTSSPTKRSPRKSRRKYGATRWRR
jgi:uncharacterized membrane protein